MRGKDGEDEAVMCEKSVKNGRKILETVEKRNVTGLELIKGKGIFITVLEGAVESDEENDRRS